MKLTSLKKFRIYQRLLSVTKRDFLSVNQSLLIFRLKQAIEETRSISIENVKIYLKRLPKELDGFRIIHLSDIHHSPFTGIDYISSVVKVCNFLEPDIFVLTGDYVSHEPEYVVPVAKVLGELRSKYGTYACLGNHDHWTDGNLVVEHFSRVGIKLLINEGFRFRANGAEFWLCGVDDYMVGRTDIKAALKGSKENEFKLLLSHNPQVVRFASGYGIDLVLSGHTHGGQIRLRTERKYLPRKLKSGLLRYYDTQVYITRGIGTVIVPLRYQCPPEISLLELHVGKN
jgi:predicted MPP superfamily phosphohydrolase